MRLPIVFDYDYAFVWSGVEKRLKVLHLLQLNLPAFSPCLVDQAHVVDSDSAINRLDHVVDGQGRVRDGDQCFHLDAGLANVFDRRRDAHPSRLSIASDLQHLELDLDVGDEQGVTHRNELRCSFGPMIPATWATAKTSPFGTPPFWIKASVSGFITSSPLATATRSVSALPPTSTICARPLASRCERVMTRLYHREMPCSTLDTVAKPLRNDIMLTGGRLMAALKVVEESPNQLVLGIPLAQRIPGLVVSLGIFLLIGYSTFSGLLQGTIGEDPSSLLVLLFLGFFLLRSVSSAVITTTVKIDGSARLATRSTSLLGISTGQVALPLDHVRRVIVGSRAPVGFSQARTPSGWLVTLDSPDGPPFVANWNGTHDEMLSFGNKIGTLVNKPLVDELERPRAEIQTAPDGQPIQEFQRRAAARRTRLRWRCRP